MFLNLNLPSSRNHQIYFEGGGIGISEYVIVWMHMHVKHSITWCCGYVHRLNNVITTLILLHEQAQINRRFDDLQGRKISSLLCDSQHSFVHAIKSLELLNNNPALRHTCPLEPTIHKAPSVWWQMLTWRQLLPLFNQPRQKQQLYDFNV